MSQTYSIYFVNQSGSDHNYALFAKPPEVREDVAVYSNVVQSKVVRHSNRAKQSYWHIDVSNTHYAWTGTASCKLSTKHVQHAHVEPSEVALATLAQGAPNTEGAQPGSSFAIMNDGGAPSFDEEDFSYNTEDAVQGSFEVSTAKDFPDWLHFVYGLATPTKNGTVVPVATVEAAQNRDTFFKPDSAPIYYVAPFQHKAGTVILDVGQFVGHSALVDFTTTDKVAAVVEHFVDKEGNDVFPAPKYMNPEEALEYVRKPVALRARFGHAEVDMTETKEQLGNIAWDLFNVISTITGIGGETVEEYLYEATFDWTSKATHSDKHDMVNRVTAALEDTPEFTSNIAPHPPYRNQAKWSLTSPKKPDEAQALWTAIFVQELVNKGNGEVVGNARCVDKTPPRGDQTNGGGVPAAAANGSKSANGNGAFDGATDDYYADHGFGSGTGGGAKPGLAALRKLALRSRQAMPANA